MENSNDVQNTTNVGNEVLTDVSGSPIKHQLEYSMWSAKVSWCPICKRHFYNDKNEIHTTKATSEHYHIFDCH